MLGTVTSAMALAFGGVQACTAFNGLDVDSGAPAARRDSGVVTLPPPTDATVPLDSGPGGDAVSDAGPPVPYLTVSAAARLCTRFQSCDFLSESVQDSMGIPVQGTEKTNFSACVDILSGPLPPGRPGIALQSAILGCVVNAATCGAAEACLSSEDLDSNDPRCLGQEDAEVCVGTDQLLCDYSVIFHCGNAAYVGSGCFTEEGGVECVKDESCPAQSSCTTPTVSDYCTNIGGHAQFDCSIYGDYCDMEVDDAGDSFSNCFQAPRQPQPSCETNSTKCDAKNRVSVCGGEVISVYDCNALGEQCVAGASSVSCVPPGAPCNPSSPGINTCTGDTISVCVGGQPSTVDCTQFGAHCVSPGVGLNSYCEDEADAGPIVEAARHADAD